MICLFTAKKNWEEIWEVEKRKPSHLFYFSVGLACGDWGAMCRVRVEDAGRHQAMAEATTGLL